MLIFVYFNFFAFEFPFFVPVILLSNGNFDAELSCSTWLFLLYAISFYFDFVLIFYLELVACWKVLYFFRKCYWIVMMIEIKRWAMTTLSFDSFLRYTKIFFFCLIEILRFWCQICSEVLFLFAKTFSFYYKHVLHWDGSVLLKCLLWWNQSLTPYHIELFKSELFAIIIHTVESAFNTFMGVSEFFNLLTSKC